MEQANQRTILLIEEDGDTRPIMKHNLQAYGYRVTISNQELRKIGK